MMACIRLIGDITGISAQGASATGAANPGWRVLALKVGAPTSVECLGMIGGGREIIRNAA